MIAWLKAIHIMMLSVWCAGLLALPMMLAMRRFAKTDSALYETQRATRFVFVTLVSPAAFIAIGTGTALIFAQETFTLWFAAKLLFVGLLAKLHVATGTAVVEVFKEDGRYPFWRMVMGTGIAALLVVSILVVVLAKPSADAFGLPREIFRPGALGSFLGFEPQPSSEMTMPMP